MVIGRTSFSFWGQQPIFCRGGFFDFLFNSPVPGIFFFRQMCVGWELKKKSSEIVVFFFDRKALTFCIFWVHPPPPWLGPCWAMLACWVVKLGSLHRSGQVEAVCLSRNSGKPKQRAELRGIRWNHSGPCWRLKGWKKNRQIEVEVVFKKGQPSLISFGNDAIVNPMRSSLRNASDEEFWTLRHRGKSG